MGLHFRRLCRLGAAPVLYTGSWSVRIRQAAPTKQIVGEWLLRQSGGLDIAGSIPADLTNMEGELGGSRASIANRQALLEGVRIKTDAFLQHAHVSKR